MIYIKDMDMPVDCLACRISCKHESYRVPGRPGDCPLEEAKDGDLIRRADAIEAVKRTKPVVRSTERNWGKMIAEQHSKELVKALNALPSAESEQTVYCMDCAKSAPLDEHGALWYCKAHDRTTLRHSYCNNGERKGGDDE